MAHDLDRGASQHLDSNNNRADRGAVEVSATASVSSIVSLISSNIINWSNPVNWSHRLNKGLISWWLTVPNRFGFGTFTWRDLCRRNDGTLTNMLANDWVPSSRPGGWGALDFDGADDYVEIASSPMNSLSSFTVSMWVRPNGTGESTYPRIMSNDDDDFELSDDGALKIFSRDVALSWVDTGITITDNTWQHIVVVQDGAGREAFKDGVSGWTDANTGTLTVNGVMRLGARYGDTLENSWIQLDDIRIYNRALSPAEVRDLYHRSKRFNVGLLNRIQTPIYIPSALDIVTYRPFVSADLFSSTIIQSI